MMIYGTASPSGHTVCRGVASTSSGAITVGLPVSITGWIGGAIPVTTPAVTVAAGGTFAAYCTLAGIGTVPPTLKSYSYSP
jgi:hypothetical protein